MTKAQLIEKINDSFIKILTEEHSRQYAEYIKSINREMIAKIDKLDTKMVRDIVAKQKINIDDMVLLFTIQNAIILIIDKPREAKRIASLLPIVALLGIYGLKDTDKFARNIISVSKSSTQNAKANALVKEFIDNNKKVLDAARKQARRNLDASVLKSNTSRRMLQDLRTGIKEQKSIEQIKNELVRKYNKLSNVDRMLDTELHAQSEYVRLEHSKAMGYTHKVWKTQSDERVRHTRWHDQVANKKVPIDSEFRAAGLTAKAPGDENLPVGERVRCRCYLLYV